MLIFFQFENPISILIRKVKKFNIFQDLGKNLSDFFKKSVKTL